MRNPELFSVSPYPHIILETSSLPPEPGYLTSTLLKVTSYISETVSTMATATSQAPSNIITRANQQFDFLGLPRELRDDIYEYYTYDQEGMAYDYPSKTLKYANGRELGLAYTCKTVANEMKGVLCAQTPSPLHPVARERIRLLSVDNARQRHDSTTYCMRLGGQRWSCSITPPNVLQTTSSRWYCKSTQPSAAFSDLVSERSLGLLILVTCHGLTNFLRTFSRDPSAMLSSIPWILSHITRNFKTLSPEHVAPYDITLETVRLLLKARIGKYSRRGPIYGLYIKAERAINVFHHRTAQKNLATLAYVTTLQFNRY
jgi:hypothetical protein